MKQSRQSFGRRIKPSGDMFLHGSQLSEAKGHLKLRSCLHNAIISSTPNIVKYIKNTTYIENSHIEEQKT